MLLLCLSQKARRFPLQSRFQYRRSDNGQALGLRRSKSHEVDAVEFLICKATRRRGRRTQLTGARFKSRNTRSSSHAAPPASKRAAVFCLAENLALRSPPLHPQNSYLHGSLQRMARPFTCRTSLHKQCVVTLDLCKRECIEKAGHDEQKCEARSSWRRPAPRERQLSQPKKRPPRHW